ncbi:Nuclear-pore anchor [Spatholobus suberectus]|nr:Nuclear-pore anchor [Spatholobus suberectus]
MRKAMVDHYIKCLHFIINSSTRAHAIPLFLSDEEFVRCSSDVVAMATKTDAFIHGLFHELDTVCAKAAAAAGVERLLETNGFSLRSSLISKL